MVTSDHNPIDIEHKQIEFDHAYYGTLGLESAFGVLNSIFTVKKTIELLTKGKERFNVESSTISVGNEANLALFNPNETYTFSLENIISTSKNSMFIGTELKGTVYGIISNNQLIIK
jgi:dihydroorotase